MCSKDRYDDEIVRYFFGTLWVTTSTQGDFSMYSSKFRHLDCLPFTGVHTFASSMADLNTFLPK